MGVFAGDPSGTGDEFLESVSDYFINTTIDQLPQEIENLYSNICVIATPTPTLPPFVGGVLEHSSATDYSYGLSVATAMVAAVALVLLVLKRRVE